MDQHNYDELLSNIKQIVKKIIHYDDKCNIKSFGKSLYDSDQLKPLFYKCKLHEFKIEFESKYMCLLERHVTIVCISDINDNILYFYFEYLTGKELRNLLVDIYYAT